METTERSVQAEERALGRSGEGSWGWALGGWGQDGRASLRVKGARQTPVGVAAAQHGGPFVDGECREWSPYGLELPKRLRGHLDPGHLLTGPPFLLSCQLSASSRRQSWSQPLPCQPCHSPHWPLLHPSRRPREPRPWTSSSSRASGTCSSRNSTCWPSDRYGACCSSSLSTHWPWTGALIRPRALPLPLLVRRWVPRPHPVRQFLHLHIGTCSR